MRKTAALCVSKVYEITPDIVENNGLIEFLQNMLTTEGNVHVLVNCLISLNEMSYYRYYTSRKQKLFFKFFLKRK